MLLGALFYDLIILMSSFVAGIRRGRLSLVARNISDGRTETPGIGLVTQDDENDTYQVSMISLGLRSDHVTNLVTGTEKCSIASPHGTDAELLISKDETGFVRRRNGKAIKDLTKAEILEMDLAEERAREVSRADLDAARAARVADA